MTANAGHLSGWRDQALLWAAHDQGVSLPAAAAQRSLIASLPDRGLRHGVTLTRVAGALDGLADDPGLDRAPVGEFGGIRAELLLMRRPVRLLADMYVLMIVASSAEDVFGLPYVDSQLLPEYA